MDYRIEGNQIYSEKGKVVATLDGSGNPVMEPGMSGPHKRGVEEFLAVMGSNEPRGSYEVKPAPVEEVKEVQEQEQEPAPMNVLESSFEIEPVKVTADQPPFSKQLGVNTPGFQDYVVRNKLTQAQVDDLVWMLSK